MTPCANCSADLPPGTRFCLFCGSAVESGADAAISDPLIGLVFRGVYSVRRRLGGGRTGDVYEATHVQLQVPLALRVVNAALLEDGTAAARFHAEARAASRLRHPNITAITDFGETGDGTPFIAMEYAPGNTLARVLADEPPMPERRVVRIGEQLLSALAEAHGAGIPHRSLTAGNVVLAARRDEPDVVKVLDFGVGSLRPRDGADVAGTRTELDARLDLRAAGALLFQLLTGPVPRGTALGRDAFLERLRTAAVSPEVEAVLIQAMAADPADPAAPPATADVLCDALRSCAAAPRRASRDARPATVETEVLPPSRSVERPHRRETPEPRDAPACADDAPAEAVVEDEPRGDARSTGVSRSRTRLGASRREIGSILIAGAALSAIATAVLAHFVSGDGVPGLRATATADAPAVAHLEPAPPPVAATAERPARAPVPRLQLDAGSPPPSAPPAAPASPLDLPAPLASGAAAPTAPAAPARRDEAWRSTRAPSPSHPRDDLARTDLCSQLLLQETLGEPLTQPRRRTIEKECHR